MTSTPIRPDTVIACDGGNITYHNSFEQGSGAWLKARKGIITASNVKHILTPTLKTAANDKQRIYFYQILADRVTDFIEEGFCGYDMIRGHQDEIFARETYAENYAPVTKCGFVTNDTFGFTLGFSPDGLVGDDGVIEIKSRKSNLQVKNIMEFLIKGEVPKDDVMQVQAGLLATGRLWCDYILYSGGLPMAKVRAFPNPTIHAAIIAACLALEANAAKALDEYRAFTVDFPATEYIADDDRIGMS